MTVSITDSKVTYTGSGITGPYTFTFPIYASTDLVVERYTIADGTTTTFVLNTDYTVSGSFSSTSPAGGTVTLTTSLSSSYKLIIRRILNYTQSVDLQPNDDLPAQTLEVSGLDRLVMLIQQLYEVVIRSVSRDSSYSSGLTIPVPSALQYLRWNSGATALENATPTTTELDYGGSMQYGADASKAASPTAGDIYVATDTKRLYFCFSPGTWTTQLDHTNLQTMTGAAFNFAQGSDIASATTTDIGAATGNYAVITGTTTITGLGTIQAGTMRAVKFSGALTLTHNATSLILPSGANITTAAGDCALFVSEGSGNWRCLFYAKASGQSVVATSSASQTEMEAASSNSVMATPGNVNWHPGVAKAWALIDGVTATAQILASRNCSSVTDNGTGDYTLNFTTAFSSANYAAIATVHQNGADDSRTAIIKTLASGSVRVRADNGAGTYKDAYISVACFGDQ